MTTLALIQAYVPNIHPAHIMPFLVMLVGAILCLIFDAMSDKQGSRDLLPWVAGSTLVATIMSLLIGFMPYNRLFAEETFRADTFSVLGSITIMLACLLAVIMGPALVSRRNIPSGEFYTLIVFVAFGGMTMALSNELLTAFIALEIMSLSLYVLTGIDRRSSRASEAAFKYFILGAFASAFLVLGIGFIFGATHTTHLHEIAAVLGEGSVDLVNGGAAALNPIWIFVGFALLFVGMCFKLSLAPFHMWAPDVYEGANTPTVVMIATSSKIAAFALMVHIVAALARWDLFAEGATYLVGFVALVSMIWGNLGALVQSNFKRMMAYSSVAQTGYMALALMVLIALPGQLEGAKLAAAEEAIKNAIVLYLVGYTVMSALALGIAWLIGGEGHMAGYRGLVFRNPIAATGMAVAMFSLVGIGFTPPTIGFMGKFYLFKEAVQYNFTALAAIAVVTSVISAFYYLNLVVTMFMREETEEAGVRLACMREQTFRLASSDALTRVAMASCTALIFLLGFFPNSLFLIADAIKEGFLR
ncbi:NADH-quinone oxidoreductase subunit NuoN [bacterium]|nr:NADH-quinone oxidoreductase subunit NuoN [bacterium]